MKDSTITKTSQRISTSFLTEQSAINNLIEVGLGALNTKYFYTTSGIRFMLAPKSQKAQEKLKDQ